MIASSAIYLEPQAFDPQELNKGIYLSILHADRIPPHAGLIFNGSYSSLTIKHAEVEIPVKVLVKTAQQKKIPAAFIRIKTHPVFSTEHLCAVFNYTLGAYPSVKAFQATCMSPVKQFLNEFYALNAVEETLLPDLISLLCQNEFASSVMYLNCNLGSEVALPRYTTQELHEIIKNERARYYPA